MASLPPATNELVSVVVAARLLNVSRKRVYFLLSEGKLSRVDDTPRTATYGMGRVIGIPLAEIQERRARVGS